MTHASAPPPVPPGWQRRQDLIARIADIQMEVSEVRLALPQVNDAVLRPRVEALLAVAAELVAVHGSEPGDDVAEALAGLQSATRSLRVPVSDPVLEVTTETLRILRAAQGRLRSAVDDALDAVTRAHLPPVEIAEQREPTATLPIQAMLGRLDEVTRRLDRLEAAKEEQPHFVQQAGLVNFFVGRMRVELDLARLHLTVGEGSFDLGALSRAAESMAELTEAFVATVRAWTTRLSTTVVQVAAEVPARVRAVTIGVATLARIVLRRAERARRAQQPAVAEPPMVWIPPGRFTMGVPEAESAREGTREIDDRARPLHEVAFREGFWLARHPVTRGEFAAFVADTGHDMSGGARGYVREKGWQHSEQLDWRNPGFEQTDRHPVVCVSHVDAEAYAAWLSRRTGRHYRLPTEAEWEYAARAGTTTARFWGDGWDAAGEYARVGHSTASIGSVKANEFGLYDMLGNVWEWVEDHWHANYEGAPKDGSAWTTGGSTGRRVLRGGSWENDPGDLRAGIRVGVGTGIRDNDAGFRLARTR